MESILMILTFALSGLIFANEDRGIFERKTLKLMLLQYLIINNLGPAL